MGSIGPVELLILFVGVVAAAVVFIRSRIASIRNSQTGRAQPQPQLGIAAGSGAPPVVVAAVPPGSVEARLLELDSLRRRGIIDADEYASARMRALEGRNP